MQNEHIVILRLSCGPAAIEWHLGEDVEPSCLAEIINHRVSMKRDKDNVPLLYIGNKFMRPFSDDAGSGFYDRLLFWFDDENKNDDVYDFDASSPERRQDFRGYAKQCELSDFKLSGCTVKTDGMTLLHWPAETDGVLRGYALSVPDPSKITDMEAAALRDLVDRATTPPTQCVLTLEHGPAAVEWYLRDITDPCDIERIVNLDVSMRITTQQKLELLLGDKAIKIYENRIFNERNDRIAYWLGGEAKGALEDYLYATSPLRQPLFREHMSQFGTSGFKLVAYEITSNSRTLDQWLSH